MMTDMTQARNALHGVTVGHMRPARVHQADKSRKAYAPLIARQSCFGCGSLALGVPRQHLPSLPPWWRPGAKESLTLLSAAPDECRPASVRPTQMRQDAVLDPSRECEVPPWLLQPVIPMEPLRARGPARMSLLRDREETAMVLPRATGEAHANSQRERGALAMGEERDGQTDEHAAMLHSPSLPPRVDARPARAS